MNKRVVKTICQISGIGGLSTILGILIACTDWDLVDTEKKPDPVQLQIIAVSDSSVQLRWTQSQDIDFKNYVVLYSTNEGVDTTNRVADTLHFSIDTNKTVGNLDHNKRYYFRVLVTTYRNSLFSPSNEVNTLTLNKNRGLTLLQPDTTTIKESSVILQWEKGTQSVEDRYFIFYDTVPKVDTSDSTIDIVNDGTMLQVDGLEREKSYWFRVYLNRNGIFLNGSNTVTIKTKSGKPKPVSVSISAATDNSVALRWTRNQDPDLFSYLVCYDTTATPDTTHAKDTIHRSVAGSIDTFHTVQLLAPDTKYWFALYAVDSTGFKTRSTNTVSVITDDGIPAPSVLSVENKSDSTVQLTWTKCIDKGFIYYKVYYTTDPSATSVDPVDSQLLDSLTDTRILKKMPALRIYKFAVYTFNESGNGISSNIVYNFPVILQCDTINPVIDTIPGISADTSYDTSYEVSLSWGMSFYKVDKFLNYKVFKAAGIDVPLTQNNLLFDAEFQISEESCNDTLKNSQTIYYKLIHYHINENNVGEKRGSNVVSVTIPKSGM